MSRSVFNSLHSLKQNNWIHFDKYNEQQASEMLAKDPSGFHDTVQESLRRWKNLVYHIKVKWNHCGKKQGKEKREYEPNWILIWSPGMLQQLTRWQTQVCERPHIFVPYYYADSPICPWSPWTPMSLIPEARGRGNPLETFRFTIVLPFFSLEI